MKIILNIPEPSIGSIEDPSTPPRDMDPEKSPAMDPGQARTMKNRISIRLFRTRRTLMRKRPRANEKRSDMKAAILQHVVELES